MSTAASYAELRSVPPNDQKLRLAAVLAAAAANTAGQVVRLARTARRTAGSLMSRTATRWLRGTVIDTAITAVRRATRASAWRPASYQHPAVTVAAAATVAFTSEALRVLARRHAATAGHLVGSVWTTLTRTATARLTQCRHVVHRIRAGATLSAAQAISAGTALLTHPRSVVVARTLSRATPGIRIVSRLVLADQLTKWLAGPHRRRVPLTLVGLIAALATVRPTEQDAAHKPRPQIDNQVADERPHHTPDVKRPRFGAASF